MPIVTLGRNNSRGSAFASDYNAVLSLLIIQTVFLQRKFPSENGSDPNPVCDLSIFS